MTIRPTAHQCLKQELNNQLSTFVICHLMRSCYLWNKYCHLKGKMVRKKPNNIIFKQHIHIQTEIQKCHPELPLHIESFFMNRHSYFTTITGKANLRTNKRCRGPGRKEILNRLQAVVSRHTKRGFHINEYHAENE